MYMSNPDHDLRRACTHVAAPPIFFMNIIASVEFSTPSDVSPTVNTVEANTNLVTRERRV
jgi:hypothetical protein